MVNAHSSPLPDHEEHLEGTLVARARQGDPDAFCELVQPHESRLFRQALLLAGDAAAAEDLAQETLFIAWKQISRFHGRCQLFTWLCGILVNLSRNALRKKMAVPVSSLNAQSREDAHLALERLVDPTDPPDARIQQLDHLQIVQECLDRLPAHLREVVYLRFFVDHSIDAIAAALNCPSGTVKSRLFNALEKLNAMPQLCQLAQPGNVV